MFVIRTDHSDLHWLLNFRHPEGQIARWIESLQQYNFTIEHQPGARHGNADALSRRPCWGDTCKHCERLESQENPKVSTEPGAQCTTTQMLSDHCEASVKFQDTCASSQIFDVAALNQPTGTAANRSPEELRQAQLNNPDVKPLLQWLERSSHRPPWEEIAPHNDNTKVYCAQWQSLRLYSGVLYRLWETQSGDAIVKQLILPKSLRSDVL